MKTHAPDQTVDVPDRLSYAADQLGQFQDLIRFADTKAGAAITVGSVLLTVRVASYDPLLELLKTNSWSDITTLALDIGVFVAFFGVFYYTFQTLLPRLEKKEYKRTVAFFLDVFHTGEESFIKEVGSMPLEELLEHTLREVYLLSEIATVKFAAQRHCFQWLRIMLVVWAIAQVASVLI